MTDQAITGPHGIGTNLNRHSKSTNSTLTIFLSESFIGGQHQSTQSNDTHLEMHSTRHNTLSIWPSFQQPHQSLTSSFD